VNNGDPAGQFTLIDVQIANGIRSVLTSINVETGRGLFEQFVADERLADSGPFLAAAISHADLAFLAVGAVKALTQGIAKGLSKGRLAVLAGRAFEGRLVARLAGSGERVLRSGAWRGFDAVTYKDGGNRSPVIVVTGTGVDDRGCMTGTGRQETAAGLGSAV
jgi:hypothetical protein